MSDRMDRIRERILAMSSEQQTKLLDTVDRLMEEAENTLYLESVAEVECGNCKNKFVLPEELVSMNGEKCKTQMCGKCPQCGMNICIERVYTKA